MEIRLRLPYCGSLLEILNWNPCLKSVLGILFGDLHLGSLLESPIGKLFWGGDFIADPCVDPYWRSPLEIVIGDPIVDPYLGSLLGIRIGGP